jgi:biotin operon repressor
MTDGWLKLYRKITEWEWYNHSEMVHLYLHLILKASTTEREWQGVKICRGQLIASRKKLSGETGISEMTIRTCLQRLQSSGEITIKSTNKYSMVTICNYDVYQQMEDEDNQQTNQQNNQQSNQQSNQPTNHSIRNKNNITVSPNVDTDIVSRARKKNGEKKTKSETSQEQPHEPGAKRKLKNGKDVSLATRAQEIFMAYFQQEYGEAYAWRTKDMVAIKDILSKITYSRSHKTPPQAIDEDSVLNAFKVFINSIQKSWVKDNFSLPTINSQYNNIITEIVNLRNGRTKSNHSQGAGTEQLARQMQTVVNDIAKADEYYYQQQREGDGT